MSSATSSAYSIDTETTTASHSREAALDDRDFELLLEGASRIDDYRSLQARFVILAAGRLGMRSGEIAHIRADWVDHRRGMIVVPRHEECTKGKDGNECGYCRAQARQMTEYAEVSVPEARHQLLEQGATLEALGHEHYYELRVAHESLLGEQIDQDEFDERIEETLQECNGHETYQRLEDAARDHVEESGLTFEAALERMWSAKTDHAAREIPFDFDPRCELIVERFFDRFEQYPTSKTTVNRRVDLAAEKADEIDADDVWPHALRATAATNLAGKGLDTLALQSMFGWSNLSTARVYIKGSGTNTKRALHSIHSL